MGKKIDENKLEYGNHPPEWIASKEIDYIEEIGEIIRFFVVNSPYKGISARGITFEEYGWNSKQLKNDGYLYKRLFEIANSSENKTFFSCDKREDTKELFKRAKMGVDFHSQYKENRIAILENGGAVRSVFKAIRNSIAHCRFKLIEIEDDLLFVMENGIVQSNKIEIKARLVIKKSTFIKWIQVVREEASVFVEQERQREEKIQNEILNYISKAERSTTNIIIKELGYKKNTISRNIGALREKGKIQYSRTKGTWVLCESVAA